MPLYEYQCPRCGRFEVIRRFSDPPLGRCPTCGKAVQKLASAPAIQFKGAGWYVTDYAKKSSGDDASKGDSGKAETGKTPAAKADSNSGASSDTGSGASDSSSAKDVKAKDAKASGGRSSK